MDDDNQGVGQPTNGSVDEPQQTPPVAPQEPEAPEATPTEEGSVPLAPEAGDEPGDDKSV